MLRWSRNFFSATLAIKELFFCSVPTGEIKNAFSAATAPGHILSDSGATNQWRRNLSANYVWNDCLFEQSFQSDIKRKQQVSSLDSRSLLSLSLSLSLSTKQETEPWNARTFLIPGTRAAPVFNGRKSRYVKESYCVHVCICVCCGAVHDVKPFLTFVVCLFCFVDVW